MAKDFYNILGVSKTATADEIKSAYRKLALQHHPDRGGGKEAETKFKEANEAYQILSNPQKRSQYDQFGEAAFRGGGGGGQGFDGFSGFGGDDFSANGGPASGWDFSGFGGFGDIFGDLFSQSFAQVSAELQISPAQAVLGDKIKIEVDGQRVEFEIPAGTQSGTSYRFRGKGKQMRNGTHGDLTLTLKIVMPKKLSKEQQDLWKKIKDLEQKKNHWWQ